METSKYWKTREIKAREKLLNTSIKQSEKELKKIYKKMAEDIITQIENAILKMSEGKSVSHVFNYKKYYELLQTVQGKLRELGDKETKLITDDMTNLYKSTGKTVELANKFHSAQISNDRIRQVINAEWVGDGKNWSQRIWTHQGQLSQKLSQGILNTLEAGIPLDNLKKELMKDFNVSYSQAKRIVNTEYVHIANRAATDRYKTAGISKYRWVCNEDERLCPECSAMDNQIFDIDSGILPVLHPNCRCTTIAVIDFNEFNTDDQ